MRPNLNELNKIESKPFFTSYVIFWNYKPEMLRLNNQGNSEKHNTDPPFVGQYTPKHKTISI